MPELSEFVIRDRFDLHADCFHAKQSTRVHTNTARKLAGYCRWRIYDYKVKTWKYLFVDTFMPLGYIVL